MRGKELGGERVGTSVVDSHKVQNVALCKCYIFLLSPPLKEGLLSK
jgi:hypothetical protein